jgi:cytidylate kinase
VRVIAIDGPVGAGKSTVARALAARLGLSHLDTGAMYRSVALAALRRKLDPGDLDGVAALARDLDLTVDDRVVLDGDDVTDAIRGPDVSGVVSQVAANPEVRTEMVRRQRAWVLDRDGGVVEGRDIGTVVFPAADLKVFLTARDDARASRRRHDEDPEALARRDHLDSSRAVSPLAAADDALVIDSTSLTVEEVVDAILEKL